MRLRDQRADTDVLSISAPPNFLLVAPHFRCGDGRVCDRRSKRIQKLANAKKLFPVFRKKILSDQNPISPLSFRAGPVQPIDGDCAICRRTRRRLFAQRLRRRCVRATAGRGAQLRRRGFSCFRQTLPSSHARLRRPARASPRQRGNGWRFRTFTERPYLQMRGGGQACGRRLTGDRVKRVTVSYFCRASLSPNSRRRSVVWLPPHWRQG